jgi:predicted dehydrogenase
MTENHSETHSSSPIQVGMIGFGWIGKVHSNAYSNIPFAFAEPKVRVQIQAVLRNHPQEDQELIRNLNIHFVTSNIEEFYSQPLDAVDICTPNLYHRDQVIEAIRQKKHIYCEKPLGRTLDDAREISALAADSGLITHTAYNRRYIPAIRQMKSIIEGSGIGQPYYFRAQTDFGSFIDPLHPMSWRMRNNISGGGALADLGSHMIDLIRFFLGEVEWVQGHTRTFINKRPGSQGSTKMETVDVDDWALCQLGMQNDSTGHIEVSRVYGGAKDSSSIEIIGSKGTVKVNFNELNFVEFYDLHKKQWKIGIQEFQDSSGMHPINELWPPSLYSMGFYLNSHLASCYDFLQYVQEKKQSPLNFKTALAAQEVLEAAYISASKSGQRIYLPLD